LDKQKIIIRGVGLKGTSAGKIRRRYTGYKADRKDETLTLYRQKERMTPAKNKGA
jgi:hypothetical protein